MSDSAAFSSTPADLRPVGRDAPAAPAAAAAPPPRRRRRVRKRFWLLLSATLIVCLALYPPPWQAAVRALLVWQAARHGCDLTIDAIEGGPLDTIHLYGVRCRQRGLPPATAADADFPPGPGTDLSVAHAQITFAWRLPGLQRPEPSWVRQFTLDGVRGRWDVSASGRRPGLSGVARLVWIDLLAARFIPADFLLHADDATLRRGRYRLRAQGLFLTGSRDGAGQFLARTMEASGPGFNALVRDQHSRTLWQGNRLTLSELDLGHGVQLARATLDGTHLARRRLDWDCDVRALGGTIRGQGAVNFSRARLALEVGGSLQQVTLGPLARLLEITGPAGGQVQQATFSFRGDPENWLAADMWLAGRATDFRWGQRRWESLELQAVVTNRRVQVHRLELRQSRNRLSLDGECSLPPDPQAAVAAAQAGRWWQAGFACNVDARLEDLRDLAQLAGPQMPDLDGRMSVNGRLSAAPGTRGYDGYLNVEGSRLVIRGAPLDSLRSTLIFHGEELDVADLQATRGGDYLAGRGSLRIAGPTDFQALGRVSIENLGVYAPAYGGFLPRAEDAGAAPIRALTAGVRLEGSVLHLDQCQGEQDGNTFQMTGSVDLRDAGNPLLDLSLTGQQPPRAADPADADAAWRAGVLYNLDLRGPLAGGATVHGDVQLLHGRFDREADLSAAAPPAVPLATELLPPLLRRLPEAWRDWPLDLRVTAADPLPSGETGRAGEVMPDLAITGTGRHPLLGGKLEFHSAAGSAQERGAWYFTPGQPENPTVSITATTDEGRRGTFYYGPLAGGRTVSWNLDPAGGELTLQPAELPPRLVEDTEFSAGWIPALPVAPVRFLFDR